MSRGLVEEVLSTDAGDVPSITMSFSNVDGQLAALLAGFELEGAEATLRVCDRRLLSNPGDAIQLTMGEVTAVAMTETTVTFQIVSIVGQLQRSVLPKRLLQQKCNYTFGGRSCKGPVSNFDATVNPIRVTTTALSGSTEKFIRIPAQALTDAGNPDDPSGYWADGYVLFSAGALATQARPIQNYAVVNGQRRLYLRYPFIAAPTAGDAMIIQKICKKTKSECSSFSNIENYGGFEEQPYSGGLVPIVGSNGIVR